MNLTEPYLKEKKMYISFEEWSDLGLRCYAGICFLTIYLYLVFNQTSISEGIASVLNVSQEMSGVIVYLIFIACQIVIPLYLLFHGIWLMQRKNQAASMPKKLKVKQSWLILYAANLILAVAEINGLENKTPTIVGNVAALGGMATILGIIYTLIVRYRSPVKPHGSNGWKINGYLFLSVPMVLERELPIIYGSYGEYRPMVTPNLVFVVNADGDFIQSDSECLNERKKRLVLGAKVPSKLNNKEATFSQHKFKKEAIIFTERLYDLTTQAQLDLSRLEGAINLILTSLLYSGQPIKQVIVEDFDMRYEEDIETLCKLVSQFPPDIDWRILTRTMPVRTWPLTMVVNHERS